MYFENEITMSEAKLKRVADKNANADYLKSMTPIKNEKIKRLSRVQAQFVRDQVASLPVGELAVVYLKFWEGQCEYEISKTLCLSVSAVRKLMASALKRLKEKLIEPRELSLALQDKECA